jgi:hypothetical protein
MKETRKKCLSLLALVFPLVLPAWQALAQTDATNSFTPNDFSLDDHFHGGRHEASLGAGVLFSPFISVNRRPTVNYAFGDAQLGFMVTDVAGIGLFRGNFELAPEVFGAGIFGSTGTYIAGGTLWFRYNFVPRQSRVVPYAQVGGGWVFMDIDHRYDGENFNFNVDGAAGLRYFIKPRISLNAEYRFQHISNANLWRHNLGLNAEGPVLGISWLF